VPLNEFTDLPELPCPQCRVERVPGACRIGNRRSECATCNNFVQNVMRLTRKRLMELHAEEYKAIRLVAERDLYPQVIEKFAATLPDPTRGAH
jgi:hypothetical protein